MINVNIPYKVLADTNINDFIAGFNPTALTYVGDLTIVPGSKGSVRFIGNVADKETASILRNNLKAMQAPKVVKPTWVAPLSSPAAKGEDWFIHKQKYINCRITKSLYDMSQVLDDAYSSVSRALDAGTSSYNFYTYGVLGLLPIVQKYSGSFDLKYGEVGKGIHGVEVISCSDVIALRRLTVKMIEEFNDSCVGLRLKTKELTLEIASTDRVKLREYIEVNT